MTEAQKQPSLTDLFASAAKYMGANSLNDRFALLMDVAPDEQSRTDLANVFAAVIQGKVERIKEAPDNFVDITTNEVVSMQEVLAQKVGHPASATAVALTRLRNTFKSEAIKLMAAADAVTPSKDGMPIRNFYLNVAAKKIAALAINF